MDTRRSLRLLFVMHLHDRHEAHLTLQTPLKQARQSLAQLPADRASAGFPYSFGIRLLSLVFTVVFVNIYLQHVTKSFHFRNFCQTSANGR